MSFLKTIIIRITPKKVRRLFVQKEIEAFKKKSKYSNISYSQEGEDLIIECFLGEKNDGFYIDVGAHHSTFDYKRSYRRTLARRTKIFITFGLQVRSMRSFHILVGVAIADWGNSNCAEPNTEPMPGWPEPTKPST